MSKMNWDYVAGFYEGEGTCGAYFCKYKNKNEEKTRFYYRLQVGITQNEKFILNEIKNFVGFGKIYKHGNGFQYNFTNNNARKFLCKILSYCHSKYKMKQIKKALLIDKNNINRGK